MSSHPAGFNLEKIEIQLLLEAIYQRYGYDFRHYAQASVRRRIRHLLNKTPFQHISELIPHVLHDEQFAQRAINEFSITVTEMFRDPDFYKAVRLQVLPYLSTYPFLKIWHAGCSTGEEAYSLAIVLKEEGVYDRSTIFATDFNEYALGRAQEGVYPLKHLRHYTGNYQKSGGRRSFGDYYHAAYESAIMENFLKKQITFAHHNLVTDGVFSEMHLIFCRNVLIYFDKSLQERVLNLLADSLRYGGFLCLGTRETIEFSSIQSQFKVINENLKIYQKQTK